MMNLKRDWALYFALSLTLLTIALFLLRVQSWALTQHIYFEEYDGRHFIYGLLYYPKELFAGVFPIGLVIFLVQLWRLRSQTITPSTWRVLGFIFIAALLSLPWLFLWKDHLNSHHISTVQLRNTTYQFGGINQKGGVEYVLAECDSFGFMCNAVYIMDYNPDYQGDMRLSVYPFPETVTLEIDGETVYTAPHSSP